MYAAKASKSDADRLIQELGELEGLEQDEYDAMDLEDFTASSLLELLASYFVGPGINTEVVCNQVEPFHGSYGLDNEEEGIMSFSITDKDNLVNVLRYSVRINGTAYTLLLSPSYINQVYIDDDGYLWNMGTNSINGRLFIGDFDPTASTGYLLYLNPCLGNNFNANHNYGSPNYVRRYYWSSNRLTYDDTYGIVLVEESPFTFFQGDTLTYVIIFLIGGVLLCLWKKSRL